MLGYVEVENNQSEVILRMYHSSKAPRMQTQPQFSISVSNRTQNSQPEKSPAIRKSPSKTV